MVILFFAILLAAFLSARYKRFFFPRPVSQKFGAYQSQFASLFDSVIPAKKVERNELEGLAFEITGKGRFAAEASWNIPPENVKGGIEKIVIYRSAADLGRVGLNLRYYPTIAFETDNRQFQGAFPDNYQADDVKYYYVLEVTDGEGKKFYSKVRTFKTRGITLETLKMPVFHIDKVHYFLEAKDGDLVKKRYPVVFGWNPIDRKLYQGSNTTPEGFYAIYNLQPKATFFKAYDIDYPNEIDKFRYRFIKEEGLFPKEEGDDPGIGGEIQIHGTDITDRNWTAGCICMRNRDLVELFSHKEIAAGTRVIITGFELSMKDLKSIKKYWSRQEISAIQKKLKKLGFFGGFTDGLLGPGTMKALGRFQAARGIPITCQLDLRTLKALEAEN